MSSASFVNMAPSVEHFSRFCLKKGETHRKFNARTNPFLMRPENFFSKLRLRSRDVGIKSKIKKSNCVFFKNVELSFRGYLF